MSIFKASISSAAILSLLAVTSVTPVLADTTETKTEKAAEPAVVAEINTVQITNDQLDQELNRQLRGQAAMLPEDQRHVIKTQLLEKMIERELLLQAAKGSKITPTEEEVSSFVSLLKQRIGSEETFKQGLEKNGITEADFKEGVKSDLTLKGYVEKKILGGISVTPEEIKKEYDKDPKQYAEPEQVKARHILFMLQEDADEATVKAVTAKAEKVLALAKAPGADFEALARENTEEPNKASGGDLGYFTHNQMVPPFADAAFKMKPGEISGLVRTQFGLHIIKVEDKKGGGEPNFETAKPRVEQTLMRAKQEAALTDHLASLKKNAKVISYLK
jgi:peptidyl-prolyl cis-trans isomerase C